jgi:glutamate formiminotransferase
VARIGGAVEACGCLLLDIHADHAHNRSVMSLTAETPAVLVDGLLAAVATAVRRIDLNRHTGLHPRVGAADVIPLVPLGGAAMEECVETARELGNRIWSELGVPVFFYGQAALRPESRGLAGIRAGRAEPDLGGPPHSTAGYVCVGARPPLVAYNLVLGDVSVSEARLLASRLRASSGGLPGVQALVFELPDGSLQLSMNLTDLAATPPRAVRAELKKLDVAVLEEELVGLCPAAAAEGLAAAEGRVLEGRLAAAAARTAAMAIRRMGDEEHRLLASRLEAEAAGLAGLGPGQPDLLGAAERSAALVRVLAAAGLGRRADLRAALQVAALGLRQAISKQLVKRFPERVRLLDRWLAEG